MEGGLYKHSVGYKQNIFLTYQSFTKGCKDNDGEKMKEVKQTYSYRYAQNYLQYGYQWLRSFDRRLRESTDYAICQNSLGSGDHGLWLHVSKPPENTYVKQILESLESHLTYAKGYYMQVAWEHEQFSWLRVTAATLSGLSAPPDLLEITGGLSDNREFVNEAAFVNSVKKVVAESLARHIYGQQGKNINIFADNSSLAVNHAFTSTFHFYNTKVVQTNVNQHTCN
ncbi:nicalin [Artemisia annua]|uniref:Nicalin n=1 Tax=Artemisia annua TaxID=35608 RepID=A0A2U1LSW1_ARTAN|nr:nicalin [Artemisia annua]